MRCQFLTSERLKLHNDLCLIDPLVTSFDGESQLNVLLYGSDEFNDKINRSPYLPNRADDTGLVEGVHGHLFFV